MSESSPLTQEQFNKKADILWATYDDRSVEIYDKELDDEARQAELSAIQAWYNKEYEKLKKRLKT